MARPSNISRRIERLLNDNYLRHAFSGGVLARVAVLVVPALLFACAAFVRVQAATQPAQTPPAPSAVVATPPAPPAASTLASPPAPRAASELVSPSVAPAPPAFAAPPAPPPAAAPVSPATAALLPPPPPSDLALATPPVPPPPPAASDNSNTKFEAAFDRTLSFNGKLELSVSTGAGGIKLTRGSANQVHIHGIVKVYRDGDTQKGQQIVSNPPIEQNGTSIRIGIQHENLRNISIDYEIEAPADAALSAATGSGDIHDTGVGQGARMTTGSGNIRATGLEGGFKLQTGSGDIVVDSAGEGDAKAQTGSGGIDLKGVHGSLDVQTGSGDIKAAGTPSAPWKLQTGSGSVELSTGNAPMNLDASTGSGQISTNQPAQMRTAEERHHLHAQLNGGGTEVRVVTGSGDIRVQ